MHRWPTSFVVARLLSREACISLTSQTAFADSGPLLAELLRECVISKLLHLEPNHERDEQLGDNSGAVDDKCRCTRGLQCVFTSFVVFNATRRSESRRIRGTSLLTRGAPSKVAALQGWAWELV